MDALLRWLSRQRPWQVLAVVLAISLVATPLGASATHPLLLLFSAVLGATIMFGYPLLVIFGFPAPYTTRLRSRIALGSCALLCIVVLATALAPANYFSLPDWLRVALGLPLTALLFAPFFIATSVVDDARRALGHYQLGDSIGTWLCIFSYPLFGVFFVQRRVASALVALDARAPPAHGGAIAV